MQDLETTWTSGGLVQKVHTERKDAETEDDLALRHKRLVAAQLVLWPKD